MTVKKESLQCPVCSWDFSNADCRSIPYPTTGRNSFTQEPTFIYFCSNCGVGIAFPLILDDRVGDFYSQGSYWHSSQAMILGPRMFPGHYTLASSRWSYIESCIGKADRDKIDSILDIGAGQGFLGMIAAKRLSGLRKYTAVEKDAVMRESIAKTWQRHFPQISLVLKDSLDMVKGEHSLVVLSHILEHINNPCDMLKSAIEHLLGGRFLFIDVPHKDYLFKDNAFPHLLFFDLPSLQRLITQEGLHLTFIGCYGRNIDSSPINYRNENKPFLKMGKIFYKLRYVIPTPISEAFFKWYYGATMQNDNGTWICALAHKDI